MPYRSIDNIALADEAFQAWGSTLEEMFISACDATLNIMVCDVDAIRIHHSREVRLAEAPVDMLLFQLLQELIFFKDAEQLLLRVRRLHLERRGKNNWAAEVELAGETIDPHRHDLVVDVKAITMHRFDVRQTPEGWAATVVVDV